MVITVAERSTIDEVVAIVRAEAPVVPIFSRARDGAHARHLYAIGVSDAVPETVEASLQLSETRARRHRRAHGARARLDPRPP